MRFSSFLPGLTAISSVPLVTAFPQAGSSGLASRQSDNCEFDSANSPECWGEYSLSTNWYDEAPDTGVIREYWFELQNKTLSPDGFPRLALTVNGTVPGPTITGDWGDTFVIHVKNGLQNNGTSIHWHGIRQLNASDQDGVASITQCPVAPGESMTYRWRATQYGSTWYHSHFSLQAWNGVFGGIVINGPASAPYDEDKGIVMLSDWHHNTTDYLYHEASIMAPPQAQNGLINGLNVYGDGGERYKMGFESKKTYRLRLVNTAIDTMWKFGIDNHTLTIIASDLVPVKPFEIDMLSIGIGQRYDVLVTADQKPGNYWMRAIPQMTCSSNEQMLNIRGIITYDDETVAEPTTEGHDYNDDCNDVPLENLVPALSLDAGASSFEEVFDVNFNIQRGFFKWVINNNTFLSDWGEPTLQKVLNPDAVFTEEEQIITLNETNAWTYLIIETAAGLDHPIHLHGHDFFILAQEKGTFTDASQLNLKSPHRRDVAMLPGQGFLAIAFQNDNPGTWLMHCHIGWHTSQGFALQLVERKSEIESKTDADLVDGVCAAWNKYQDANMIEQEEDSGV
ncbi:multicopper oxidase [Astrocystis sublimbata]|nr:multicopper oxidase [Astrocystis sublimbata]